MKYLILGTALVIHGLAAILLSIRDAKDIRKKYKENDNIIHYVGDGGEFYRMDFENNIGQCIIGAITVVIGVVFWYKFLW